MLRKNRAESFYIKASAILFSFTFFVLTAKRAKTLQCPSETDNIASSYGARKAIDNDSEIIEKNFSIKSQQFFSNLLTDRKNHDIIKIRSRKHEFLK